jgi:hypothetical protein
MQICYDTSCGLGSIISLAKNLIPAVVVFVSLFTGAATYGQDFPLRVTISATQSTVEKNKDFPVSTAIRNVSEDEQSLPIWSCSFPDQWTADNPVVRIQGAQCMKNDVIRFELKPGQAYERELSIHVGLAAGYHTPAVVTFRLQFEPASYQNMTFVSPVWSNALTVNVID